MKKSRSTFDVFSAHRRLARSAQIEAERAGLLLKGHNSQDAGDERERIVARVIRCWFPGSYTMSRGQMVSSEDLSVTRPIDLIVADTARWFPLVEIGGAVQILAEGVRAAFEIKSSIAKKSDFANAIEKLSQASQQVKECRWSQNWPPHYLSCLFAYRGPARPDTMVDWLAEISSKWPATFPIAKRPFVPNCIIVLQKYVLIAEPYSHGRSERVITVFEFPNRKAECSLLKLHELIERRLELHTGSALERVVDLAGGYPSDMKARKVNYPGSFELLQE